jgi:FKBP-type peptidyl-prolyl cis-trans isomerase FklB
MKITPTYCSLALCTLFAASALAQSSPSPSAAPASPAASAASSKKNLSYAVGMDVGSQLKKRGLDLDQATFFDAIKDGLAGAPPKLTKEEMHQALVDFANARHQAQSAFLEANKNKPGVVTLADGLQYKVDKEGTGPIPAGSDTVTVKYKGTLIDGTVFDSSEQHGGTATFPVDGVIKGWTEALQKMKVGSKWTLYVPAGLAYGDRGAGTDIPPGATLIFDVELDSIGGK